MRSFYTIQKLKIVISILFYSSFLIAQKPNDDFTGKWKAPKGAIIIVSKSLDGFIGKTEAEGALVLKEVKYINNKWTGIVMNPKENLVAKCELLLEEKALKIIAKKGLLYKTIVWTKL